MSELVPARRIEKIVGAPRHATDHFGRAVSAEQTVYILHSHACIDTGIDLRKCQFSRALDRGIDVEAWTEDVPLRLAVVADRLVPATEVLPNGD